MPNETSTNKDAANVGALSIGEVLEIVVDDVRTVYEKDRADKSPSVLMNAVDIEMNFKSVTVSKSGIMASMFSKDNTASSTMEIRLATRITPPGPDTAAQLEEDRKKMELEKAKPPNGSETNQPQPNGSEAATVNIEVKRWAASVLPNYLIVGTNEKKVGDLVLKVEVNSKGTVSKVEVEDAGGSNEKLQNNVKAVVNNWAYEIKPRLPDGQTSITVIEKIPFSKDMMK